MMWEEALVLSPPDRDDLRELLLWYREHRQNLIRPAAPPELARRPDVYLARCSTTIPALTIEAGTGTDSSVGVISKRDCKLYRVDDKDPNIDVDPLGIERTVYNPSTTEVPASTLFLAVKTADGKFIAVAVGGSSGSGSGSTVEFTQPANDGATPPKPKLKSHVVVDYDYATDTVYVTGTKRWARDMNL